MRQSAREPRTEATAPRPEDAFRIETFDAVRNAWPERLPLTVRLSITDWVDGGVTVEESIELTKRLKASGLDLLDASHGVVVPDLSKAPWGPGFLLPHAGRIRKEAGVPVAAGWFKYLWLSASSSSFVHIATESSPE